MNIIHSYLVDTETGKRFKLASPITTITDGKGLRLLFDWEDESHFISVLRNRCTRLTNLEPCLRYGIFLLELSGKEMNSYFKITSFDLLDNDTSIRVYVSSIDNFTCIRFINAWNKLKK